MTTNNYSGYTVTLSTTTELWGIGVNNTYSHAIVARLARMIAGQFPGIVVEFTTTSGCPTPTRGEDSVTISDIDTWIESNWLAAL